jgi:Ser/Thr protein kinase RdoA (MazF antagonist)
MRRLRNLAALGLTHYDLKDPKLTYHGYETNLLYRVTTANSERFMLRLASPGWRTLTDLQSEALWVNALERDTDIPVPTVMLTRDGEGVLSIKVPDVPDIWHMTLMRYAPGRLLGYMLTEKNLAKMGRLFAKLHIHGASWQPPAGFTQHRFEHWLSRGEADLISETGNLTPGRDRPVSLKPKQQTWIDRMIGQVEAAYAAVDQADLRVIHCDLWHDNIKLHQGQLYPFDFEDTVWGYRAHDIAMAMLDLLETVGEDRYPKLLKAFTRGYTKLLAWPEERIEPFQIGRMLWVINWVACNQSQYLQKTVERHIPVFEHFDQTGQVILPKTG